MDVDDAAARLGVPVDEVARVHDLAGDLPSAPVPARADAPALLDRLAVKPDDAAEILAGWPSPEWPPELQWLLDRSTALIRADLGGWGWLPPGPELPRDRGPAWRHFYVYVFLALVDVVLKYHRDHGVAETVSWTTLADLGRNLAVDRRMNREGWPVMQAWLTLHWRGAIYELGRLQHHRGNTAAGVIDLHIPEAGPMTPEAVDASLDAGRAFFPRHFPDEHYTAFGCGSWLLDPQLLEYLPESSNIVRFQRRFVLQPYEEPVGLDADVEVLRFVFRTLTTPLDRLPRRTVLQRAIIDHLRAGRSWQIRRGHIPI